jgi:hypothetical protein
MEEKQGRNSPDCFDCVHLHIVPDMARPRACDVFGVQCANLPSIEIYQATGKQCPAFEAKAKI